MSDRPAAGDIVPILLRVPRHEIAYVKFVFESYEGVAVVRTLDRGEALLVALVAPDFEDQARRIVAALGAEAGCEEVPVGEDDVDWLGPEPRADFEEDR